MSKEVPTDGYDAFYAGYELEDNPFPEWELGWEEWDRDFMDAHKNYEEEN